MLWQCWKIIGVLAVLGGLSTQSFAGQLHVGAASADITPDKPAALSGQFHLRLSTGVESPVTVNAIALESREGDQSLDQAVIVSCDVVGIPADVREMVRQKVAEGTEGLDPLKVFLTATHTHTAPELRLDKWILPKEGVTQVEDYREFFASRVADAVTRAWQTRKPGSVTWALTHAVVAYNRRAVYANGTARMYGPTNTADFRGLEGYEDHDIGTMFFWNGDGGLTAAAVNVSCPTQEVEGRNAVNADYWHPIREALRQRYGEGLCVLGLVGAAGDQSPHLMIRKAAEERMRKLRGLDRLNEIARRIVDAVEDAYAVVKDDRHGDVPLIHKVETVQLPMRVVTEAEYVETKAAYDACAAKIEKDPAAADKENRRMKWYEKTLQRFEEQKTDPNPMLETEIHVIRIGDAVVCTNQFELFTDFGIRIKGRSKAEQTFIVQLVGPGSYLPSARAVAGGHYSAIVHSNLVGPEGGQILVDETVKLIDSMWPDTK